MWHISHEGGPLEDPTSMPEPDMFQFSADPRTAPAEGETVEIGFEAGTPVTVNGERMAALPLLELLNEVGGRHGVGRVDLVEDRIVGLKSRGVYETPGGTILYEAHRALESITLDRETLHYKQQVALKYAELVYYGQWFCPLRHALEKVKRMDVSFKERFLENSLRLVSPIL